MINYGLSFFLDRDIPEDIITELEWFLEDISGKRKVDFILEDYEFQDFHIKSLESFIEKRLNGIPYAYITGKKEFFGLDFSVDSNVLIPRNETEILVEKALDIVSGKSVLDMCTGSGCIGICVARFGNPYHVLCSDISHNALKIAKKNSENILNDKEKKTISFVRCDKYPCVRKKFDVLISNPPYIPSSDILKLEDRVKDHEPLNALDGGKDGLYFYRYMSHYIHEILCENGSILLETGFDQGESVSLLFKDIFEHSEIIRDYSGHDRIFYGKGMKR